MPKQDYISVLSQVDCFVMPSRGEAFCIPALEAMALGVPAIYTEGIGMDFCVGQPIESRLTPCFGAVDTLLDLDTAATSWSEIDQVASPRVTSTFDNQFSPFDPLLNSQGDGSQGSISREIQEAYAEGRVK